MSDIRMPVLMDEEFCVDLIRWGGFTPTRIGQLAEEQLLNLFERNPEHSFIEKFFGENTIDFVEKYMPDLAEEWSRDDQKAALARRAQQKPLVWKEVTIDHGTQVRMQYGGTTHLATVWDGKIEDESGRYSPSEWASKVAGGTSRNAWRDLWFKEMLASTWVPAQLLRDQAQSELAKIAIKL